MISLNDIRISENNRLVVSAEVNNIPSDPAGTFKFTKAVAEFSSGIEMDLLALTEWTTLTSDCRKIFVMLPLDNLHLENDIVKVTLYVEGDEEAEMNTTCGIYSRVYEGYAYKKCLLSNHVLSFAGKDPCDDIYGLASAVARVYALESAIEVRDWETIKRYWNTFFKRVRHIGTIKCGCHGN